MIDRALAVIPTGSQTYSKSHKYFTKPFFASRGVGGYLIDEDDKPYDDYVMALGAVILGYKPKSWLQELDIPDGLNFSCPHPLEVHLAEKLVEIIPSAEMVKFFKNGSDATEIAVRLARAYTKKDYIISFGYHGFHDWYVSSIDRSRGTFLQSHVQFKSAEELSSALKGNSLCGNFAAVILEPTHPEARQIVEFVRQHGALVIFDEVLTGFRYNIGGYQKLLGITPDLSCFGKCMANGLPLSAVVGKRDLMQLMDDGGVFASSTFGGETVALAAALKTIEELEKNGKKLWSIGGQWYSEMDILIRKKGLTGIMVMEGLAPRCGVKFNDNGGISAVEYQSLYQQEFLKRGILTHGINNFCLAHTEAQINSYLWNADIVLDILKKAKDDNTVKGYLEKPIQTMFKR